MRNIANSPLWEETSDKIKDNIVKFSATVGVASAIIVDSVLLMGIGSTIALAGIVPSFFDDNEVEKRRYWWNKLKDLEDSSFWHDCIEVSHGSRTTLIGLLQKRDYR